jgi:hypothetical protein
MAQNRGANNSNLVIDTESRHYLAKEEFNQILSYNREALGNKNPN